LKLVTVFWGIVGYTRWPDTGEGPLRVCLSEDDRHSSIIRQSVYGLSESAVGVALGRPVVVHSMPTENAASVCNIVFISGPNWEKMENLSRSLAGAPVLTIGEGEKACSEGGMFCLLSSGSEDSEGIIDRFAANLDAISSSSLWVNPQALRLSKHHQKQER